MSCGCKSVKRDVKGPSDHDGCRPSGKACLPWKKRALRKGMRMTEQRRVIARVLEQATDHPDVRKNSIGVLRRSITASRSPRCIALVKLFEDSGVIARHDFGAGRSRF